MQKIIMLNVCRRGNILCLFYEKERKKERKKERNERLNDWAIIRFW